MFDKSNSLRAGFEATISETFMIPPFGLQAGKVPFVAYK
jgi:hypothetical protein